MTLLKMMENMNSTKPDILASVLIPTRKRVESLRSTIESFLSDTHIDYRHRVELLVGIDEDDVETIKAIEGMKSWVAIHGMQLHAFVGPRPVGGYNGLWQLYTRLQQQAKGEFLIIFNDDARVCYYPWIQFLEKHSGNVCIICPQYLNTSSEKRGKNMMGVTQHLENMGNIFPIVHRRIPEITGNFGLHSSVDVWFRLLGEYAGITVDEPGIHFIHVGGEDSQHWLDNMGNYDAGGSYKMDLIIRADADKIRKAIQ